MLRSLDGKVRLGIMAACSQEELSLSDTVDVIDCKKNENRACPIEFHCQIL